MCPAERNVDYEELLPFNPTTNPPLKSIYKIIGNFHKAPVTYKMDKDAHELFKKYHDELKQRKLVITHDENCREIITKAIGQMARVCMIVHVLDNVVEMAQLECDTDEHNETQEKLSSTVGKCSALQAIAIMNYILDTKFAMMPSEAKLQDAPEPAPSTSALQADVKHSSQTSISYFPKKHLPTVMGNSSRRFCCTKELSLKPAKFPAANCYPTSAAEGFLKPMESLGVGDIEHTANNKSIILRKRHLENMPTEAKNKLPKINLTDTEYEESMEH